MKILLDQEPPEPTKPKTETAKIEVKPVPALKSEDSLYTKAATPKVNKVN